MVPQPIALLACLDTTVPRLQVPSSSRVRREHTLSVGPRNARAVLLEITVQTPMLPSQSPVHMVLTPLRAHLTAQVALLAIVVIQLEVLLLAFLGSTLLSGILSVATVLLVVPVPIQFLRPSSPVSMEPMLLRDRLLAHRALLATSVQLPMEASQKVSVWRELTRWVHRCPGKSLQNNANRFALIVFF